MRPLTLREFAENLRREGDIRQADLSDEILMLIDIESDVAEPYSNLTATLEDYVKDGGYKYADQPEKALEWLGDRNELLLTIEKMLADEGYADCDPDDAIRNIFEKLDSMESTLNDLQKLIDEQPGGKLIYDL